MNSTSGLRRAMARVTAAFREMNDIQRRALALRTATDRYLHDPGKPPDTYAEFLMRTSGVLMHEPSARARERRARGAQSR
ncbi:MAG TPA: hypothetical protein VK817_17385 [Trebonia sp.]|jgi:hypothetical protein|nr:hypothetical protein [Trebonia sp.]